MAYISGVSTDGSDPIPEPILRPFVALVPLHSPPLPEKVRRDAGHHLNRVQRGEFLAMPISRPMPSIGPGVHELRLSDRSGDWRIVYRIDEAAILVVDAFRKTTRRTELEAIRRSQARLAAYDGG